MRTWKNSMASGLVGAAALTLLHEAARRNLPHAPRLDVLGMRALRRIPALRHEPPRSSRLRRWALASDIVANSLFYAAIPARRRGETWARAVGLGAAAGVAALALPGRIGLGEPPDSASRSNQAMTVLWYLAGAVAAAATAQGTGYGRLRR